MKNPLRNTSPILLAVILALAAGAAIFGYWVFLRRAYFVGDIESLAQIGDSFGAITSAASGVALAFSAVALLIHASELRTANSHNDDANALQKQMLQRHDLASRIALETATLQSIIQRRDEIIRWLDADRYAGEAHKRPPSQIEAMQKSASAIAESLRSVQFRLDSLYGRLNEHDDEFNHDSQEKQMGDG